MLIYLAEDFINYLLVYINFFSVRVRSCKRVIGAMTVFAAVHMVLGIAFGEEISRGLDLFTGFILPVFALVPDKKNYLLYPIVYALDSEIVIGVRFILEIVPGISRLDTDKLYIITQLVVITGMICFYYLRKKVLKGERREYEFTFREYAFIYFGIVASIILLGGLQFITYSFEKITPLELHYIGAAGAVITLMFLSVMIEIAVYGRTLVRLTTENELKRQFIRMQAEQFELIIEEDRNIRRIRHDLKGHFDVIKCLMDKGDDDRLKEYLNTMVNSNVGFERVRITGNQEVDAIISSRKVYADQNNVVLDIGGSLPWGLEIDAYDLCTVLYNLIQNAIEECIKIENISDRKVKIRLGAYNDQLIIIVENRLVSEVIMSEDGLPVTRKKDKKEHGFGSRNVKAVADKYNGSVTYENSGDVFRVTVQL
jgi:hypothetical protein